MIIRKHTGRTSARAEIDFKFPTTVVKRSKWYVACCPALDVCSQGGTVDEARANLAEALKLFILSCLKRKTLDAVFDECGFSVIQTETPAKVRNARTKSKMITVPIPLAARLRTS